MLNEVWQLVKARERAGLTSERTHPRVKSPGKTTGPCLRVRLTTDGSVAAVESVTEDEWPGFWTVMEGNENSFPVMRLKQPLVDLDGCDQVWTQLGFDLEGKRSKYLSLSDRHEALKNVIRRIENADLPTTVNTQRAERYVEKSRELCKCGSGADDQFLVLVKFAEAYQAAGRDLVRLLKAVAKVGISAIGDGRIQGQSVDAVEMLAVGKGRPKNGKQPNMNLQLAFDLAEDHHFTFRLYCRETRRHLIDMLPRETEGSSSSCSFSGLDIPRQIGPFPKIRLPILNKDFPLFSMYGAAECNTRYGMTESAAVPVSQAIAGQMADALTAVLDASRSGKSWRGVASGKFERRGGKTLDKLDLLVVYPESKPELDANVASIFGDDESTVHRQFDADTSAVCEALDGIVKSDPASTLNILLFRKVSEGQAQIVVAESPTVAEVIAAARRWSDAAANAPDVVIPLPPKEKKQPPIEGIVRTLYPDQVVRLLSEQWVRQGTQAFKAPGIGLSEVLHLMLRTSGKWESARDRMLDLFVSRLPPLLIGVGGQLVRFRLDKKPWVGYPENARPTALRAVAVAGILLHAHNRQREVYMASAAFDIGQFLKLSDTLHKDYCIVVRKGSLPPSLIGNAMMPTAIDNPRRAVADLADRMRVYTGWARTVRDPKSTSENDPNLIAVREARKTLRRFEPLAERLTTSGLPERCDNTMKAEMLLGYLAKVQDPQANDKEQNRE